MLVTFPKTLILNKEAKTNQIVLVPVRLDEAVMETDPAFQERQST